MMDYRVTFHTGDLAFAWMVGYVEVNLVGTDGESGPHQLSKWVPSYLRGVSTFNVSCSQSIGQLVLIKIRKTFSLPRVGWFLAKMEVKSPIGVVFNFPVYQWITDSEEHIYREGKALLAADETTEQAKEARVRELDERRTEYSWKEYKKGTPHCIRADTVRDLPLDEHFSDTKQAEFAYNLVNGLVKLGLTDIAECKNSWTNIHDMERLHNCHRTKIGDYVCEHWKDDAFFGYQFLNGINPMLIKRCRDLPHNFPVTDQMVFQDPQFTLDDELKKGNLFLCDYKVLDGVPANIINGQPQYLMAPLVLLHRTPDDKLMPIAIQLKQAEAWDNPIFTPADSMYDWLLAKIFVRSADFNLHELNAHLLRTHLLAEVFTVSLLRNLPKVHPLYKLLIPHTRYTLHINILARNNLISENGVFTKYAASGGEGMLIILQRSLSSLTYRSLCIHDDMEDRGLEDVPGFYYREDGQKLWDIIHRFVEDILRFYYKTDARMHEDTELQSWIGDIYEHGFLSNEATGIPEKFSTVDDLVKFVTMVLFTCSAQHSAVNTGQFDYDGWMPNTPSTLKQPPPTTKGTTTEADILETFPEMGTTVMNMTTLWLLSTQSTDTRYFGEYPEDHFTEDRPCQLIKKFQAEIKKFTKEVNTRNEGLEVPYTYLDPQVFANSVSI